MSKKASRIFFHFLSACSLSKRAQLKSFIISIFRREERILERLDIIFCDDKNLLELNIQFLKHDFYTDILSFPLSNPGKPLVAEIYISIQRVKENAANLDTSLWEELHRVVFHGVLHFCGYKDKTQADTRKMRAMEDKYLALYFKRVR
jgi:probable rRNA maturation factor